MEDGVYADVLRELGRGIMDDMGGGTSSGEGGGDEEEDDVIGWIMEDADDIGFTTTPTLDDTPLSPIEESINVKKAVSLLPTTFPVCGKSNTGRI